MPDTTTNRNPHPRHIESLIRKAARFANQMRKLDAEATPAALQQLAQSSVIGAKLAELAWEKITLTMPPRINRRGEEVMEDPPSSATVAAMVTLLELGIGADTVQEMEDVAVVTLRQRTA